VENTLRKRIGGTTKMNFDLANFTTASVVIIPVIIALVQAIKMTGFVRDSFAPLVSIAIGVVIAFLANHNSADLTATILNGVLFGLSASGLYSGISTTQKATAEMRAKRHKERTH
jgi:hypothetical protein